MKSRNQGITLIALIVTIIILLILAGITIWTLTGDNGVLNKANSASEETKKKNYEEILKIIGNGLRPDKVINNWSNKTFLDEFEKEISKDEEFSEAKINRKNDETIIVITKEGYVYQITEDEVKYIGKQGENVPPDLIVPVSPEDLEKGNVKFILTPSGWTNTDVLVEIQTNIKDYILQYSVNAIEWKDYTQTITCKENEVIYARLINNLEEEGGYATYNVTNIDKELPTTKLTLTTKKTTTASSITATVEQKDELSKIDIQKCRWIYNTSDSEIGLEEKDYTGRKF